jgi:hypothetical protein
MLLSMKVSHNAKVLAFLESYARQATPPQYAVMLKGKWGAGKTHFVREARERFEHAGVKTLYVSLYGIGSPQEIESEFFRLLHPVLGSDKAIFAGKLLKGLLKGTLKIDLDHDGKDDGNLNIGIPDASLQNFLNKVTDTVLIFDDLERCSIAIDVLLGYLNHFVEHGGQRVIVVANEDEIQTAAEEGKKHAAYFRVKEKLVGKTFEIEPDFDSAFDTFLTELSPAVTEVVRARRKLVADIFTTSPHQNLRHVRQALLDYERLTNSLDASLLEKNELLTEVLQAFLIYSFEIKAGVLTPSEIKNLRKDQLSFALKKHEDKVQSPNAYQRVRTTYPVFEPNAQALSNEIWAEIFRTGLIDQDVINEALRSSRFFEVESQPDWVQLWHGNLNDTEFSALHHEVLENFRAFKYRERETIRHISGMLLRYAGKGLGKVSPREVLTVAQSNIDYLIAEDQLIEEGEVRVPELPAEFSYGLGYAARDTDEFKELDEYIKDGLRKCVERRLPAQAQKLLATMENDTNAFARELLITDGGADRFFDIPVLSHIEPQDFFARLDKLQPRQLHSVAHTLKRRYQTTGTRDQLRPEIAWLKNIHDLVSTKAAERNGLLSGMELQRFADELSETLKPLL